MQIHHRLFQTSLPERFNLTEIELAWLAGLLEGEGSFLLYPSRVNGKLYRYPAIALNMTDKDVVEKVCSIFNCKIVNCSPSKPGGKPQFRANIRGKKSIELMKKLLPHMGERRSRQINILIDFQANKIDANEARSLQMKEVTKGKKRNTLGQFLPTEKTAV